MRTEPFVPLPGSDSGPVRVQGREDMAELNAIGLVKPSQATRLKPPEVLIERVNEDPERQVSLELRRAPGQHQIPPSLGARTQLGQQMRLPDPRLTHKR